MIDPGDGKRPRRRRAPAPRPRPNPNPLAPGLGITAPRRPPLVGPPTPRHVEHVRRQAANDAHAELVAGRGPVAGPPTPQRGVGLRAGPPTPAPKPKPKVIRFAKPGPERDAAVRRLVAKRSEQQVARLEPAVQGLQQYSRPIHAVAGATRAAIHGQNPVRAAVRGAELKDRVLFSDVLKDLGAPKAVQGVGGFALDVALDPTTYITGGLSASAREAAAHAGTKAAAKALRAGADRRTAVAAARSASRKALAEHPGPRGVSLGFGPFKSSGRTTGRIAAKTGMPAKAERARTSGLGRMTRHVNPNYRPPSVSREDWQAVRDAQRRARHMTVTGERDARNRAIAVQREMERGGGRDAAVVDALERRDATGLNEHERRVYTSLQRDYHEVHGREHALGLVGDKFREFGYAPRRHQSEIAPPGAPGSLGVSRRGTRSANPESSRFRTNRKMRSEFRGTDEDVYVPEVAVAHYLRMRDSAHRIAQKHLIDKVGEQGERFRPDTMVPEGHGVYELTARTKPRRLTDQEVTALRRRDGPAPGMPAAPEGEQSLRRAVTAAAGEVRRARLQEMRARGRVDVRAPQADRKVLRQDKGYRAAATAFGRAQRDATAARKAWRNAHGKGAGAYSAEERRATSSRLSTAEQKLTAARARVRFAEARVRKGSERGRGHVGQVPEASLRSLEQHRAAVLAAERRHEAARQALRQHGQAKRGERDARMVVLPDELARRAFEGTASIDELRGLGIAWDRALQGRVKTLLTVPNPQYHLTNLYGDTFNAWLGQNAPQLARNLGTSARVLSRQAKTGRAARDLQRTAGTRDTTVRIGKRQVPIDKLMREAREDVGGTGFVGRDLPDVLHSQTKEALEGMGRGRFAGKVPGAGRVARTPVGRAVGHPVDTIRAASQYREDWVRTASYIGARRRGMSRDEAQRFVQEHHFDYGDLTQFEKSIARRILPFYTFTARNVPLQIKASLTRPGKYATLEKAREETARAAGLPQGYEGNLEPYEQRGQPFGVPGVSVGGKPAMLYPKLPSMDLGRLTTPDSFSAKDLAAYPGKVVRAQSEFLMAMLSPLIKIPAETTSNYNSFFRDKIDSLMDAPSPLTGDRAFERKPMPGYLAKAMPQWMRDGLHIRQVRDAKSGKTLWEWPAKLDYLLKQTPLSGTALQYGTGVANSRGQSAGLRAGGFLTGLRVAPYDATDRAARKQSAEYRYLDAKAQEARNTGDARTPAGVMTPEYRALLKRKNDLGKQLGYLGRKPAAGGGAARGFDFKSAPKQSNGSAVPQGFDWKSVKPPG